MTSPLRRRPVALRDHEKRLEAATDDPTSSSEPPAWPEELLVVDSNVEDAVLTVDEAAALLRVNRKTLYEAIRAKKVPAGRIGATIRLSRKALLLWLQGNGGPALGDDR